MSNGLNDDEGELAKLPVDGLMATLSETEREDVITVAYHEAGHAVIGMKRGFQIERINIQNAWMGDGGQCSWDDPGDNPEKELTVEYYENLILRAAAGQAAEDHLGVSQTELSHQLVQDDDYKIKVCAAQIAAKDKLDPEKIATDRRAKASQLVQSNWSAIETIANELCIRFYLNREQIKTLLPDFFK